MSATSQTQQGRSHGPSLERLVRVIQDLSLARDLEAVLRIVRHAARELTGADGATFVLREGDFCYYADEEAIAPLWKGSRFPISVCISGWVMTHRRSTVIEDIYDDPRVPVDAYRPTFVKSLAMVPIRSSQPIGAIGNYWATRHRPTPEEVGLLEALADSTSIALENVRLYAELERRVLDRTEQLEAANRELQTFSFSVSHDLRSPLQAISGYAELLQAGFAAQLGPTGLRYVQALFGAAQHMGTLIEDFLRLSRAASGDLRLDRVDLSAVAREVVEDLRRADPDRRIDVVIQEGVGAEGDPGLLRVALTNLLGNAWKFTRKTPRARIEFGSSPVPQGGTRYFVRDNGAGFDIEHAPKLFEAFQRFHSREDYPGTGVGLATVRRIVERHGGHVWAESRVGEGATFHFTLP